MAQTRKKRSRKHRGTAAGTIEKAAHNRTTRSSAPAKPSGREAREARMMRPPSWQSAANKAAIAAIVFGVVLATLLHRPIGVAAIWTVIVFLFYTPLGYWTDRALYNRRMRSKPKPPGR